MANDDPSLALLALLDEAGDRIARRWARAVDAETARRAGVRRRDLGRPLAALVGELRRILAARGSEAPRLFAELVRHHGGARFEQGFGAGELVAEFHALEVTLLDEWERRHGPPPRDVARLASEITAMAAAEAVDDYVRRVRAARAHLREEAAIEQIVGHLAEGILAVESDGTVSYASPPAARLLGVPEAELTGVRRPEMAALLRRLDVRDEAGSPLAVDELPPLAALAAGAPVLGRWLRIRRPGDGEPRHVETDAIPIREDGELRGVVATLRDRTDEYRQREALAGAYEELRRLHIRLLRRSRAQAAGALARSVAGTLNNAMNAISLRCRLAADAGVGPEHLAPIEAAVEEVGRLAGQLQEMVAAPRPGQAVPLDEVVAQALELARPELTASAAGRSLTLEVDLAAGCEVRAGRGDLLELVTHLLLPALEDGPEGGIVRVATERDGDRARLRIASTTLAPPEEALAAAAELAAAWGGRLEARRADGAGLEVEVELPALPRPAARPAEAAPAPTPLRAVLVVDDDDDNREVLVEVLALRGLDPLGAATGGEALARARDHRFDAALVDLALPDTTGWEVVRALRRTQPRCRIAVVTGYEPPPDELARTPVDEVFRKPIDIAGVLRFLGHEAERTLSP